jgi:glycine/D-amino acid oxidase-like deaminating enzyme
MNPMPANPPIIKNAIADVTIIGAGIIGLWCAVHAVRAGLRPLVIDKTGIAAGASGGLVGALMPHQPSVWSPKKALQLEGLLSLPGEIAQLEAQTGLCAGYAHSGRLMPIWTEAEQAKHMAWQKGAQAFWPAPFQWNAAHTFENTEWLAAEAAPFGAALDSLAARLDPRAMCQMLYRSIENEADFHFGTGVSAILDDRSLLLNDANRIDTKNILITTGINSFDLMAPIIGRKAGTGVKGQAASLRPQKPLNPATLPVIFTDGLYVIAHDNGLVAVGSTSENQWSNATSTDDQLDALLARARVICPLLRDAVVVERWAGVRPKHESRDPVVAELAEAPGVVVATGGFKISFAVAHLMAREAIGCVTGAHGYFKEILAQGWLQKPR